MNRKLSSLRMVAAALAMATLACSTLSGGAATQKTPVVSTVPATSAPVATTVSQVTPTVSAATATGAEASATLGEATAAVGEATATPGSEATQGVTPTYDTTAAQSTVPPLLTADAATAAAATGSLSQWAASAKASSQYGDQDWSASQADNAPDSPPTCSDETTAWAGASANDKETLELTYTTTVVPVAVNIYESYGPGSIVKVDVEETNGTAHTIFTAPPLPSPVCPLTLSIGISGLTAHVNRVMIYFDQGLIGNWDEIDAVQLVGNP